MYFPFAIRFFILSKNSSLALAPASESSHSFAYAASLLQAGKAFRYHLFFHSLYLYRPQAPLDLKKELKPLLQERDSHRLAYATIYYLLRQGSPFIPTSSRFLIERTKLRPEILMLSMGWHKTCFHRWPGILIRSHRQTIQPFIPLLFPAIVGMERPPDSA